MKIMVWNVQGLGNPLTFLALKKILKRVKMEIVFLCETRKVVSKMEVNSRNLGYECCLVVGRTGTGGGLALMWRQEVDLYVRSYSLHHIDAIIKQHEELSWRFSGIYGHPEAGMKKHTWELLRRLSSESRLPWICGGDFNEHLEPNAKVGGRFCYLDAMAEFRQALSDCKLIDMGFFGLPFTWSNRRFGSTNLIEERLDRFLCSCSWQDLHFSSSVSHLTSWASDHCLVLLEVRDQFMSGLYKSVRPRFHYEAF